jgi:hypothetical protein
MKTGKVEDVPSRALLAMCVEFTSLYLLGANPLNREQLRMWGDLSGRAHSNELVHTRVLLGALLERDLRSKEIEDAMENGIPQTDTDFVFDD